MGLRLWCLNLLSTYFRYIVAISFISEGNGVPNENRRPFQLPYDHGPTEFELKLVVIGTDCIDSCKIIGCVSLMCLSSFSAGADYDTHTELDKEDKRQHKEGVYSLSLIPAFSPNLTTCLMRFILLYINR